MMKFVKGNLENIANVEIFPIISLLIFFIFFVGLFIYVFTRKNSYLDKMKNMPLKEEGDDFWNAN